MNLTSAVSLSPGNHFHFYEVAGCPPPSWCLSSSCDFSKKFYSAKARSPPITTQALNRLSLPVNRACLPGFNPVCTLCSLKSSYTVGNSSLLIFDCLSGKMGWNYWASQQASLAQSFKVSSQLIGILDSLEAIYCQTLWSLCTKNFTTKCMMLMKNTQGDFQYPQIGIWITPRSVVLDLEQK